VHRSHSQRGSPTNTGPVKPLAVIVASLQLPVRDGALPVEGFGLAGVNTLMTLGLAELHAVVGVVGVPPGRA
jgi:hypothetical protein